MPAMDGFDQAIVGQRAGLARLVVERLECATELASQCGKIGFLVDQALRDQDAVRADPDLGRAQLGERE